MENSWDDLLFAHWPINPEFISSQLPSELTLDTWDGQAYIGVVPFKMKGIKLRTLPSIPTATDFLELNVRTYVTYKGRPGIYFFSLDASSSLAVIGARAGAGLKYFRANMHTEVKDGMIYYSSKRIFGGEADLIISYKPLSDEVFESKKGSIEEWFTERYCLFSQPFPNNLLEVGIHHQKWPLQKAYAKIEKNTMALPLGINLRSAPSYLHYSKHLKVLIWPPRIRKFFKDK